MCVCTYVYSVLAREIMCNAFTLHTHTHTHRGNILASSSFPTSPSSTVAECCGDFGVTGFHLKSEHMQQVSFNCKIYIVLCTINFFVFCRGSFVQRVQYSIWHCSWTMGQNFIQLVKKLACLSPLSCFVIPVFYFFIRLF